VLFVPDVAVELPAVVEGLWVLVEELLVWEPPAVVLGVPAVVVNVPPVTTDVVVAAEVEVEPDDTVALETRMAEVSEEPTLFVQNPAPTSSEELKAPTWPPVQQKPLPWLFL